MDNKTKGQVVKADENIFEALEVANSGYEKIRLDLMLSIRQWFKESGLNQQEASQVLKCTQPQLSAVLNTKYEEFTIDRLVKMVSHIGKNIELRVLKPENLFPAKLSYLQYLLEFNIQCAKAGRNSTTTS